MKVEVAKRPERGEVAHLEGAVGQQDNEQVVHLVDREEVGHQEG